MSVILNTIEQNQGFNNGPIAPEHLPKNTYDQEIADSDARYEAAVYKNAAEKGIEVDRAFYGLDEKDGGDTGTLSDQQGLNLIKTKQQELVNAGYNIGTSGPQSDGVDGQWGDKSQGAYNKHRASQLKANAANAIKGTGGLLGKSASMLGRAGKGAMAGVGGVGGLLGKGLGALTGAGERMQGNVQGQLAKQNTLSDGSILGQGEAGYVPLSDMQKMQQSAGGVLSGAGNIGLGAGKALGSLAQGNLGGAGQGAMQAGKGILGGGLSALKGLSTGAGMLGKVLQGASYGAKY